MTQCVCVETIPALPKLGGKPGMRLEGTSATIAIIVQKFLSSVYVPGCHNYEVGRAMVLYNLCLTVWVNAAVVQQPTQSTTFCGGVQAIFCALVPEVEHKAPGIIITLICILPGPGFHGIEEISDIFYNKVPLFKGDCGLNSPSLSGYIYDLKKKTKRYIKVLYVILCLLGVQ